jgi:hypothetical protein
MASQVGVIASAARRRNELFLLGTFALGTVALGVALCLWFARGRPGDKPAADRPYVYEGFALLSLNGDGPE